jgi:hypothetical protein
MERLDLVQKLAEQLVSDLFERGGTDDKQEEEVPAPFTVHQIHQVLEQLDIYVQELVFQQLHSMIQDYRKKL